MPTGYTADIEKGITFNQYALSCARAFGACVTMRDDSSDTPIPEEFQPSDWNKKELAKAKAKLSSLNRTSVEESSQLAISEYETEMKRQEASIKKDRKLMAKYMAMLEAVNQWQPPTQEHIEFKTFMADQIERSLKFDGMEEYYNEHPPKLLSGEEWLTQKKAEAIRNIEYHTKEYQAEIDRVNIRNAWIKALRDSLEFSQ